MTQDQAATDLPGRLGVSGIWITIGCFFAGLVAASLVAVPYVAVTGAASDSYGAQICSELGLWFGIFVLPVVASRVWGTGSLRRDYGLAIDWVRDVPVGIAAGLVGQFVLVPVVVLTIKHFDHALDIDESAIALTKKSHGAGFVVLGVLFVLAAPVIEELFFRGLFQRALQVRMRPLAAVAVSGAVFGLVHMSGATVGGAVTIALALAAFGWVLGALLARTGRLGPGIIAHVTFNTVAMVQLVVERSHH